MEQKLRFGLILGRLAIPKKKLGRLWATFEGDFFNVFIYFFCPQKHEKNGLKSCSIFFQYCQPAQNQPKSHILFHKNVSLHDFYIMTLHSSMYRNLTKRKFLLISYEARKYVLTTKLVSRVCKAMIAFEAITKSLEVTLDS